MKKYPVILFFLFISHILLAQPESFREDRSVSKYLQLGFGVGTLKGKNSYLSSLSNTGNNIGIDADLGCRSLKSVNNLHFFFKRQKLTSFNDETATYVIGTDYFIHRLWYKGDTRIKLYPGIGFGADGGITKKKESSGYNKTSIQGKGNIYLSFLLEYNFKIREQHFGITQQVASPLIGLGVLPRYGFIVYRPLSGKSEYLELRWIFLSVHNNWGLNSNTNIYWRIKKEGKPSNTYIKAEVRYHGYRIDYETKHQLGETVFNLGIIRKF